MRCPGGHSAGRILAGCLLALSLASGPIFAEGPSFAVGRDGVLSVGALPDVLSRPEVRPHLSTGLTTSFVVRVTASDGAGRKVNGGGRIDVRFEPWDEVFLVDSIGVAGRGRRETVASFDRLVAWWRALEIPALRVSNTAAGWKVKVELSMIPFSQSEQREAQRWFSDSLGEGRAAGSPQAPGAVASPEPRLNRALDLLIATSIKRRSVVSFAWNAAQRAGG